MKHTNVLIFGATGEVGSAAALAAAALGARVHLAMRDPSAPNPYLSADTEAKHNLQRVHADLSIPETLTAAVQATAATAASIYSVRAPDHMRSALAALHAAGIQHIVFLSTNAVRRAWRTPGDLASIEKSFFVPWKHAQVELALAELPWSTSVVRPGFFASNPFRMYLHRPQGGEVCARVIAQDIPVDPLDPQDIGRVVGTLVVEPARAAGGPATPSTNGTNDITSPSTGTITTLHGPALLTQREQWQIINARLAAQQKAPVPVIELSADEYAANLTAQHGTPRPIALSLARSMAERFRFEDEPDFADSVGNVQRITGQEAVRFEEFVEREIGRYL